MVERQEIAALWNTLQVNRAHTAELLGYEREECDMEAGPGWMIGASVDTVKAVVSWFSTKSVS